MKMKKEWIYRTFVIVLGFLFLWIATDGYTTFTIEEKRLNELRESPPQIPNITVQDNKDRTYHFDEFEGKYMFMTFIYTNCSTACPQMEASMQEVFERLDMDKYEDDIVFLSVSFDTERDTVEVLDRYANYFNVDGDSWRMLRVPDDNELENLLDMYGVTVIPEGSSDFQHNTSFYLIKPDGQLLDTLNYREPDEAVEVLEDLLEVGES